MGGWEKRWERRQSGKGYNYGGGDRVRELVKVRIGQEIHTRNNVHNGIRESKCSSSGR